jgi:hypothetical protein
MLGDCDRVNVMITRLGFEKCSIRGCNNKARYNIFVDDGRPQLSRLFLHSCDKHLPLSIKKGWDYNTKQRDDLK